MLYVPNIVGVVPAPDGTYAYAYCYRDPEYSDVDTIRKVDPSTGTHSYVCLVPGYTPANYDYDQGYRIQFIGLVNQLSNNATGVVYPAVVDPVWGTGGSLEWQDYPNANLGLPSGKYKQLRITLKRDDVGTTSPYLKYIRIPTPLLIQQIPWHSWKNVYIDTDLTTGADPGSYNMDIAVWWPQE